MMHADAMRRSARLGRFGLLVVGVILATAVFGWIGPVFVGLVFAAVDGRDTSPAEVALGCAAAWALILLATVLSAGMHPAGMIGASLGVPAVALPLVSILFAAAVGWSSATLALVVRRAVAGFAAPRSLADSASR